MEPPTRQDLQQTYPAVADSVRVAARALARFAAQAGASSEQIEAVRLAASEALTNVVKRAYPDGRIGSLHVSAAVACGELCVEIADDGCGIRPQPSRRAWSRLDADRLAVRRAVDRQAPLRRHPAMAVVQAPHNHASRQRSVTWVSGLRDLTGSLLLLNHNPSRPGFDDHFLRRDLVTFDKDKTPGVRAGLLVLAGGQLDDLIATELGAFAAKPDPLLLLARPLAALDRLVHFAKQRFVSRHPPLSIIVHAGILPDRDAPRRSAGVRARRIATNASKSNSLITTAPLAKPAT
jgi:hypothetical protein